MPHGLELHLILCPRDYAAYNFLDAFVLADPVGVVEVGTNGLKPHMAHGKRRADQAHT